MKPLRPLGSALTGVPDRPTIRAFLDHWLAHVAWPRLRFSTARVYAGVVGNIIVPTLGALKVKSLEASDIGKAQLVWEHAGVTLWMRRKAVEVLRSALNHATALGLCDVNVAQRARIPAKRVRPPTWLDLGHVRKLLSDVRGHALESAYILAVLLGLRRGEIAGLTWADVDFRNRRIVVRWNRVEWQHGTRLTEPKSAASRRVLAMPDLVYQNLIEQRKLERRKAVRLGVRISPSDPVLTTRSRKPYWTSYLYADFRIRLDRLGIRQMRFHDLRHTAASILLGEGVPPRTVMEMMGHRNLEVTMLIYGHVNLQQQRDAVRTLDRALRRHRIS